MLTTLTIEEKQNNELQCERSWLSLSGTLIVSVTLWQEFWLKHVRSSTPLSTERRVREQKHESLCTKQQDDRATGEKEGVVKPRNPLISLTPIWKRLKL